MARRKLKRISSNCYDLGGFIKDAGQGTLNYLKATGDIALSGVGLSNVIQDDAYKGTGAGFFRDTAEIVGGVTKAVAPIAANIIAPGSGQFVAMGQQGLGQFNPQDEALEQQRFQSMQNSQNPQGFRRGGRVPIEVEGTGMYGKGGELEVSKGRILKDFKGKPTHEQGGYQYKAVSGRTVIPNQDREAYMTGDTFTRNSIEQRLRIHQKRREQGQAAVGYHIMPDGSVMANEDMSYKKGGRINFKSAGAYKKWLAYGHASGKFAKTPGHQAVSIQGKARVVKHENGGDIEPDFYASGGGIYMKPQNKGKVTSWAKSRGMSTKEAISNLLSNNGQNYEFGGKTPAYFNIDQNQGYPEPGLPLMPENDTVLYGGRKPFSTDEFSTGRISPTDTSLESPSSTGSINWGNAAYHTAALAPTIYNLGYGIFGKKEQIDPNKFMNKGRVPYRDVDFSQISKDIESQGNIARKNAYSAAGGSAGSYLSNQAQISANTQGALARARIAADESNRAGRFSADQINIGVEDANLNRALTIDDLNARNRAKRSEMIGKGLEGVSAYTQQQNKIGNMSSRDQYLLDLLPSIVPAFDKASYASAYNYPTQRRSLYTRKPR